MNMNILKDVVKGYSHIAKFATWSTKRRTTSNIEKNCLKIRKLDLRVIRKLTESYYGIISRAIHVWIVEKKIP